MCPTCLGSGCAECLYSGGIGVDEKEYEDVMKTLMLVFLVLLLVTILAS